MSPRRILHLPKKKKYKKSRLKILQKTSPVLPSTLTPQKAEPFRSSLLVILCSSFNQVYQLQIRSPLTHPFKVLLSLSFLSTLVQLKIRSHCVPATILRTDVKGFLASRSKILPPLPSNILVTTSYKASQSKIRSPLSPLLKVTSWIHPIRSLYQLKIRSQLFPRAGVG